MKQAKLVSYLLNGVNQTQNAALARQRICVEIYQAPVWSVGLSAAKRRGIFCHVMPIAPLATSRI